jgi:beta-phosphoglucomutase-like phosphatase (HAD superfamily)
VNESREYGTWADWLGVPRHTFSAVFGSVIAKGLDYRETFQVLRPGFDLEKGRQERADAGKPEWFGQDDLYPDARPALNQLRADGLWIGIAGNQTVRAGGILRALDLAQGWRALRTSRIRCMPVAYQVMASCWRACSA